MPGEDRCECGWPMPQGLQLLTGGMDRVFLSCGGCGVWWVLETSVRGGWKLGYVLRRATVTDVAVIEGGEWTFPRRTSTPPDQ